MHPNNIVLIGFMGVGKGSLARALARKTGMFTVDTDDLIESLENRTVKRIFKKEGESYFRELERKTARWLEQGVSNCIISTGGGFHMVENLNRIGTVIYLRSDFDSIVDRMLAHPNAKKKIDKRPLLKNRKKARELFARRTPEYERKADITVDVTGKSIPSILDEMLTKLG